ncbi:hypothetical protein [Haloarchaeobius sp. HME9146]|uniref:hypothetical protein n=1 Tax=Haloarchaeobius sp. HME9146 TaxID=2978732 RepID=UPI0021C107C1|nr:hypothetical protein [Haloarchaeobius sp. HME9146]MCT9097910.1 hypothetical protein [Haloarchaeobius sp. HME9146]
MLHVESQMTPSDDSASEPPAWSRRTVLTCLGAVGASVLAAPVVRPTPTTGSEPGTTYSRYRTVNDGSGCIVATVPAAWHRTAVAGDPATGVAVAASPVAVTAPTTFTLRAADRPPRGALAVYMPGLLGEPSEFSTATREWPLGCTATDRLPYTTTNGLDGLVTVHGACRESDALVLKYLATTVHGDGIVLATVTIAEDRDVAAALTFLDTLRVDPTWDEREARVRLS